MSTYRANPFGEPVIVAEARSRRPQAARRHSPDRTDAATAVQFDPGCPFCPGNEAQTPPEADARRPDGSQPDTRGWEVRVFPNLYPALAQGDDAGEAPAKPGWTGGPLALTRAAQGLHEVAVHSPDHSGRLSTLGDDRLAKAIEMWQRRLRVHRDTGWVTTILAVNEGREAGASLAHPHAQLFAMDAVPPAVVRELEAQNMWLEESGHELLSDVVAAEAGSERLVGAAGDLVAWAPYWSFTPYEVWIAPRARDSAAGTLGDSPHAGDLATLLGRVTRDIADVAGDPALNVVFRDPPHAGSPSSRWHARILPRTSVPAGFEFSTGMRILTLSPEAAAEALRAE